MSVFQGEREPEPRIGHPETEAPATSQNHPEGTWPWGLGWRGDEASQARVEGVRAVCAAPGRQRLTLR